MSFSRASSADASPVRSTLSGSHCSGAISHCSMARITPPSTRINQGPLGPDSPGFRPVAEPRYPDGLSVLSIGFMDMAQQPAVEWGRVQFGGGDRCIDAGGLVPVRVEQAEVGARPRA